MPPHAAPFLAIFSPNLLDFFAAAGDITNAVNKADGMGQWTIYIIRCLWFAHLKKKLCDVWQWDQIGQYFPTLAKKLSLWHRYL